MNRVGGGIDVLTFLSVIGKPGFDSDRTCANDVSQPSVSKDPLADEQVAVYRAVLQDYLKDSKDSLNLADKTEVIEGAWTSFDGTCPKNHDREVTQSSGPMVHRFSPETVLDKRVVIVDASEQQKKIDRSDPQNLVKRAIDDHVSVSDTELNDAIKQAFKNAVFTPLGDHF